MTESKVSKNRVFSEERDYLNSSVNPTNDISNMTINVPDKLVIIQPGSQANTNEKQPRTNKKLTQQLNPVAPPKRDASNSLDPTGGNNNIET